MTVFNIPIVKYAAPFDKIWKRILMHFGIALFFAGIWLPSVNYDWIVFLKILFMLFLNDCIQAAGHITVYHKLEERFDWIENTRERLVYSIVLHIVWTYLAFFTVIPTYLYLVYDVAFYDGVVNLAKIWALPLVLVAVSMVFAVSTEFFMKWKKSFAAEEQIQTQMMSYKYEALRNQVNPHFLLESFSTLKKLVNENPTQAVDFIHKMSDIYRHVLDVKDKEFISLSEELANTENYIRLLTMRYGNQLKVVINITPEPDDLIIPLALQSLLEHSIGNMPPNSTEHVTIVVTKVHDHIQVISSGNPADSLPNLSVIRNLEQQYQFYSKKPIKYEETSSMLSIHIPVLKLA